MYYWNRGFNRINLEDEFFTMSRVGEIWLGTAFFSNEGLELLKRIVGKYKLRKERVHIFVSDEFTNNKPHELLEEMCKIGTVKMFFNKTFHSKVYLLKGEKNKLIYGSSNFTAGGLKKNIEFDNIEFIDGEKLVDIERFFKYCDNQSEAVNEELIKYFEERQEEIEELRSISLNLRKKIKGFVHKDDKFDKDDYNLDNKYFDFADYETFFNRNRDKENPEIRQRRKVVQDKMLTIHNNIYDKVKALGIECHWKPGNITSLTRPCEYNRGQVAWLGVRYGKRENEVKLLNESLDYRDKDEVRGFQKHACLQYCITQSGFEVNLFLGVKHDAVDRSYVLENIKSLEPKITKEVEKLKGNSIEWNIYNNVNGDYNNFKFDNQPSENFCKFLKKYDMDGCESFLSIYYTPGDDALNDINTISTEILDNIKKLVPLYNVMAWRPKK